MLPLYLEKNFPLISGDPISWQQDPRNRRDDQHNEDSARVLPQLCQGTAALHQQVDYFAVQRFVKRDINVHVIENSEYESVFPFYNENQTISKVRLCFSVECNIYII